MPCRSDYMEATDREVRLRETAQLLIYVKQHLKEKVSDRLLKASNDYYCSVDFVPELCKTIRKLTPEQMNDIVYNSRDKTSRRLADWWEEHEEADRKREAKEAEEKQRKALRKQALAKLSKEERMALDV